jgi:hypothetical protein
VGLVALKLEVGVFEAGEIRPLGDLHDRRGQGLTGELQPGLVHVVQVEVGVAQGVDEFAHLQAGDLGHHLGKQGVAGDVERHAQEDVRRALVELAGELAGSRFTRRYVELEQAMTGRQRHVVDVGRVPGADDVAAAVGVGPQAMHNVGDLIDHPPVRRGP